MARVTLDGVGKDLGDRTLLEDVTLDVFDGEFFCVIGPSGCGKSLLLRLLAGLDRPSRGRISFDGEDVTHVPAGKRDVAMVFQDFALYPHLSAARNMGFPLQTGRRPDHQVRERVVATGEEIGAPLVGVLTRMAGELSAGFRQRVAIGRAVIRRPRVFLLDEPLSISDAKVSAAMWSQMRRVLRCSGVTTVYVTPDDLGDDVCPLALRLGIPVGWLRLLRRPGPTRGPSARGRARSWALAA